MAKEYWAALYGTLAKPEKICAFCAYHKKNITIAQLRSKRCLQKGCTALLPKEHPIWKQTENVKKQRKERKQEIERMIDCIKKEAE